MSSEDHAALTELAAQLTAHRTAFARVTVVRAQPPTSAHAGDLALVTADGRMHGFVGGQCAAESVRVAAVDAIADGEDLLLRILPAEADTFPETACARVVVNPCMSGGALELFIEPVLPAPIVHVAGDTPIAVAVVAQAKLLGFAVTQQQSAEEAGLLGAEPDGAVASVIATHGGDEAGLIRAALDRAVPYIGLVASRRRGAAVLATMELTASQRDSIHTPAGIDIGAVTAAEVALSILAQVVSAIRRDGIRTSVSTVSDSAPAGRREIDPICGMTVVVTDETPTTTDESGSHWFCCLGCRDTYLDRAGLQATR
ncbi:XdhC family protein [Gordonia sp. CPCC 205515]|uniref:XdhC family protein n=1 Tax=Gordonia sp. CPCC 205515 TaxID=3140791 RepID=UPI003AF3E683